MKNFNRAIQLSGEAKKVGTPVVTVLEVDASHNVVRAKGATVPTDGDRGYALGCQFVQTDGATETVLYVNEGSATSADFNPVLGGVAKTEVVAAANTITAAESGKTFFLNSATEFASTLPAPAAGLHYRFIVTAAPTGASYTVATSGAAQILAGQVHSSTGGDADSETAATATTITFADGASVVGDWAEVISDGTNWYAQCFCDADAGITITG